MLWTATRMWDDTEHDDDRRLKLASYGLLDNIMIECSQKTGRTKRCCEMILLEIINVIRSENCDALHNTIRQNLSWMNRRFYFR